MTKFQTFIAWSFLAIVVGLLAGWLVSIPYAKYEICSKYYAEISKFSCMVSNYGLPPAKGSK